jgi:Ca2+/H+ antiporter, TMEM165/GDT1 family
VVADGLAILVGAVAGKHLPERHIQLAAAALFLLFGAYMLLENIFPAASVAILVGSAVAIALVFATVLRAMPERLRPAVMRTEPVSPTVSIQPDRDEGSDQDIAGESLQHKE